MLCEVSFEGGCNSAHLIPVGVGANSFLSLSPSYAPHPAPPTLASPLQAQLLSLCENSVLYLWSLEEMLPEVVHKTAFKQDSSYNK